MDPTLTVMVLAFLLGTVAGLRTMTAPAAVSRAARLGHLDLGGTRLAFLGYAWTPFSGAAVGAGSGALAQGLAAGVAGAVVGTLGGHAARTRLAAAFGRDLPAALLEDAVAIGGAVLIVLALP